MRDTPQGRNKAGFMMPMKGGCWGGDNYRDWELATRLATNQTRTRSIVAPGLWRQYSWPYYTEFFDMVYLRHLVWPAVRESADIFDRHQRKTIPALQNNSKFLVWVKLPLGGSLCFQASTTNH